MNQHEIRNKHLLNKKPPEANEKEWQSFLNDMESASDLKFLDYPIQLDLELNSGCNMSCPFCVHGYENIKNKNVDINKYIKILEEAYNLGSRSLKLNYINEPMIRKDLEDFVRKAKDIGFLNIYMATNGTMLTKKRRADLLSCGITKVFISIDAISSDTYSKQRLSGRYNQVVENVTSLIRERNNLGQEFPLVRVSFLKNKINIHEAEEFEKYWTGKADLIAFQTMNDVPDHQTGITILNELPEKGCDFPFKQLVVDSDGDILPCCKMSGKKLALGNIENMSLKDAWFSDSMQHLKKIHNEGSFGSHEICSSCLKCGD